MVHVLREAVLLEQLVRWVLELGEGLRRAADVAQDRGALGRAGVRAEGQIKDCNVWSDPSALFLERYVSLTDFVKVCTESAAL